MTKTFSKVLAIILSLCVLFSLPVMAGAEDNTFVITSGDVQKTNQGNWKEDYIGSVTIKLTGDIYDTASDVLLTVGAGESASDLKTIMVKDAAVAVAIGTSVTVSFSIDMAVSHEETYNFYFPAGTFVDEDGNLSEEYTVSISGNKLVEMLDTESIPVTPIQKLIVYLSGLNPEGFWKKALDFLIAALNWFVNI